ncbi:MAG: hypothetical protein JWR65_2004, partial [Massilia sp.]|nr:hypothetical protein [Massilia sp.]
MLGLHLLQCIRRESVALTCRRAGR